MDEEQRPVLIYDGKCGFCKIWIEYWNTLTGDAVRYAASQDIAGQYPQIPRENFSRSVQLVLPSGEVLSGARAVFETLAVRRSRRPLLWLYDHLPRCRKGVPGLVLARCRNALVRTFLRHRLSRCAGSKTRQRIRPAKVHRHVAVVPAR
jgi:predicted DCC family thiol-disulfide oxidoreductase YuxK